MFRAVCKSWLSFLLTFYESLPHGVTACLAQLLVVGAATWQKLGESRNTCPVAGASVLTVEDVLLRFRLAWDLHRAGLRLFHGPEPEKKSCTCLL